MNQNHIGITVDGHSDELKRFEVKYRKYDCKDTYFGKNFVYFTSKYSNENMKIEIAFTTKDHYRKFFDEIREKYPLLKFVLTCAPSNVHHFIVVESDGKEHTKPRLYT